ncbi:branched-chain amino acid ABC transporter permease [Aeromicrobium sp. UC242_57]|uniref:branched-chain amino acid ABC transporter permease n=1 Tax=Aeromicrobium sp. UC242_57 TaxID=3374624 RepID=UPI00378B23BD
MNFFLQQTVNGVALGSLFALYALGFSLVFANMKVFHVAHAAIFTGGAVFAWELTDGLGWSLLAALPAVALLAGVLNVVVYLLAIRHLQGRKNSDMFIFVSSLGAGIVLTEIALHHLKNEVVRLPFGLIEARRWSVAGLQISNLQLIIVGTAVAMFVILRWLLTSTQFGREVNAVASDREVAAVMGINAERVSILVFFMSGALAGVGATLVALAFNTVEGNIGHNYLVIAMAVLVIGGIGSVAGGFLGGLMVGLASAFTTGYLSSSYRDVVVFGLLMAFLVLRPDGLVKTANVSNRA